MADTRASAQKINRQGMAGQYTVGVIASTTDFVFKNSGRAVIHVKKSGANPCTVTFKTQAQVQGLALAAPTISVPATTGDMIAGPFPPGQFNDGVGDMRFNFSEVTGLTFAIYEM